MSVCHSEYIADITGSTSSFAVANSFSINPGNPLCFPWLSNIAQKYESYNFKSLVFRFETESATSQTGYVALIPDYNASDPAPSSKVDALQYESAIKCAPWESAACASMMQNLHKRKSYFVRNSAIASGENIDLYDVGYL